MSTFTQEEIQYAKVVLKAAYGERFANQVPINENTFLTLAEILEESGKCSDNIDLVPRPHGSIARPTISYALKLIKQICKEILIDPAKQNYYICNLFTFQSRRGMFFY